MIEHLTDGGFIVDLTILSKEQTEVLETLKRSVLLNSPFYRYNYPLLKPFFSESIGLKALTYFKDAEEKEMPEGIKYKFLWGDIKKDLINSTCEYFTQYL